MSSWALKVGGRWATDCGHVGPITYQTLRIGGMGEASWQWTTLHGDAPHGAARHAPAEIYVDGERKWHGRVDSVDPESWHVTAVGKWIDTTLVPAATPTGIPILYPEVAVLNAREHFGLDIGGIDAFYGTGVLDGDEQSATPMTLERLLTLFAQREGSRVGVDDTNRYYLDLDPTAPKWIIVSDDVKLAPLGGDPYNRVMGLVLNPYYDPSDPLSTEREKRAVFSPAPVGQQRVGMLDMTELGWLSPLDATAYVTKVAKAIKDAPRLESAVTLSPYDIRTMGGRPADLLSVKGGDMARVMGLTPAEEAQAGTPYLDVVIDKVTHTQGVDAIEVEFVGTLPTTMEDAYAALQSVDGLTV